MLDLLLGLGRGAEPGTEACAGPYRLLVWSQPAVILVTGTAEAWAGEWR